MPGVAVSVSPTCAVPVIPGAPVAFWACAVDGTASVRAASANSIARAPPTAVPGARGRRAKDWRGTRTAGEAGSGESDAPAVRREGSHGPDDAGARAGPAVREALSRGTERPGARQDSRCPAPGDASGTGASRRGTAARPPWRSGKQPRRDRARSRAMAGPGGHEESGLATSAFIESMFETTYLSL